MDDLWAQFLDTASRLSRTNLKSRCARNVGDSSLGFVSVVVVRGVDGGASTAVADAEIDLQHLLGCLMPWNMHDGDLRILCGAFRRNAPADVRNRIDAIFIVHRREAVDKINFKECLLSSCYFCRGDIFKI